MIKSDFHVHSCYCDGKDTPENIVLTAISKGMNKIGFSGHSYTFFDDCCMSPENTEKYKAEIKRLKSKYQSQIKILLGTEQDYYSEINKNDYDYIIGSVHYVKLNGEYLPMDHNEEFFREFIRKCNNDPYEACEKYYSVVSDVVNKTQADIIGHFDLVTKFNDGNKFFDENHERYIKASNNALDILLKTGKPFEINTGAISRGYKILPYPSKRILKYISDHNGSVIFSSDAHQKENLMYKFDLCEKLADEFSLKVVEL